MRAQLIVAAVCGTFVINLPLTGFPQTEAFAATQLERGSYLVNTIMACGSCHSPRDAQGQLTPDNALSGGIKFTTPAFIATAPNITPDGETGLGTWTDEEIKRALIEGVRPDHGPMAGTPLAAVMPANFYKGLLPADIDAIVVYLRSLKPVRNQVADPEYKAPVKREPYPDAERGFSDASPSDPITRGKYLATIGHCMECHATCREGSLISLTGLVTADAPLIRRWCRASIQIGRALSLRFSEGPSADQADYQLSGVHLTGDE